MRSIILVLLVGATLVVAPAPAAGVTFPGIDSTGSPSVAQGEDPSTTGPRGHALDRDDFEESTDTTASDVTIHTHFDRLPDRPGEVTVRIRVESSRNLVGHYLVMPDVGAIDDPSVSATDGISYRIEESAPFTVEFTYEPRNRSTSTYTEFVTDSWTYFEWFQLDVTDGHGGLLDAERTHSFEHQGTVMESHIYLGNYEEYTGGAAGQQFHLVVPAAANMTADPERVIGALENASRELEVGGRDERVDVFVVPTSMRTPKADGRASHSEFWVDADQPVLSAENTWLHEYVHTRQAVRPSGGSEWYTEGGAEYLSQLLALKLGLAGFEGFQGSFQPASGSGNALSDPATWSNRYVPYELGARAIARIDYRIRLASDGERSFETVVSRVNEKSPRTSVDNDDLVALVGDVANESVAQEARRLTTTAASPERLSNREYVAGFGEQPPVLERNLSVELQSPWRDSMQTSNLGPVDPTSDRVALSPNETLVVTLNVSNRGGGSAWTAVDVAGDGVDNGTRLRRVGPGETYSERVTLSFDEPGDYRVSVGEQTIRVSVEEPTVNVRTGRDLLQAESGETVTIFGKFENPTDLVAAVTVPIRVDGEVVATRNVTVPPHESVEITKEVTFQQEGTHTVSVGSGGTLEVTVGSSTDPRERAIDRALSVLAFIGLPRLTILGVLALVVVLTIRRG